VRWVLGVGAVIVAVAVGVFGYFWVSGGAHPLAPSVAVERFRHESGTQGGVAGPGPAQGIYSYRGSGTETISVPPKSQSEGPEIPGTVIERPGGCFEFRLDYSDAHWQSWNYCARDGGLATESKAGYYLWDFVVFKVDDTSTYTCTPLATTVPAAVRVGTRSPVSCTGTNDHLSIGPVHMTGSSTVVATSTLKVGRDRLPAVLVREDVTFSGGQQGSNRADTWFSVSTGLPLRGTWSTVVSTASPVGVSTLRAHGTFALTSDIPRR
jgi:hypothetical protein